MTKDILWKTVTFEWRKMIALKKEKRNTQRGGRETDICSVTSQGKRNIKRGERKINPSEFSKKSVGNLRGSNFSKEAVAEARLQGVSKEMEPADINHSLEKRKSIISQSDSWT